MSAPEKPLCVACRCYPRATRGLCLYCYDRYRNRGRHVDMPRSTWVATELVGEADILLARGYRKEDVARQLGVKWDTITTARRRLKKRAARREGENSEADHESD